MPLSASLPSTATRLSRQALAEFGESLGRALIPPHVVALSGELGAGKTTLIQAICRGYGVASDVTSPTFALVHVYEGARSPVFHLDLYRLRDASELTNIGWDDILNEDAIVLVEWPERAGAHLPHDRTHLHLAHVAADADDRALHAVVE